MYDPICCSIVIPTHNRPDLLQRAVCSALKACPSDGEVIVVDDHSLSPLDLSSFGIYDDRLRLLTNPGAGGAADARNYGCSMARGDIIFFLDDDDEILDDYCGRVLAVATSNRELIWGFSSKFVVRDKLGEFFESRRLNTGLVPCGKRPKDRVAAASEGFWIRKAYFLFIGGFDACMRVDEDTDLCVRLLSKGWMPWFEALPGVRVYRDYLPMLAEGGQLTRSTNTSVVVQCYRRTCEKNLASFSSLSRESWYLCERYLRRLAREPDAVEVAVKFICWLNSARLKVLAAVFFSFKLLVHGSRKLFAATK